jgi:DNA polymerase I-like protein with 3'-5' exonuclease and polymerase domains|tara:strand:+ start:552 stop:2282 length:1731 start_codon:yes stop_codon:yes gene_type:complete
MTRTFSCDIETDGLNPSVVWCIAVQNTYDNQIIAFHGDSLGLFKLWLASEVDTLVFHNGIDFDIPVLEKLLGINFSGVTIQDTLIMSQLDEPRRDGGHSLANWGEIMGFEKDEHKDWSKFSQEMLEYCKRDVEVTTKLYKLMLQKGLSEDALQLEYTTKKHCSLQEKTGWKFDQRGAMDILRQVNEDLRKAEEEVHKKFVPLPVWKSKQKVKKRFKIDHTRTKGYQAEVDLQCYTNDEGDYGYWSYPEFNLGSRQQVGRHLVHYGWKPTVFTGTGRPKVDESTLKDVDIPEAKLIARYLMLQKRQGQVNSWLDEYNDDTGRIHARVHTMGTVTHRMSSSNPNLQQVTARGKEYGSEMRALFIVPEDKVLVGADLSGLELRCLAHYMKDDNYTQALLTEDIHTVNQKSAGLETRDESKRFIYAFLYGAGDFLIGKIVGGGIKEGKEVKAKFLDNTPSLKKLRESVQRASNKGYLKALDGRRVLVRSEHASLNFLLQSAGSIIAKRSWVIFHELAKEFNYKQLGVIHDEIQIECNNLEEADSIGKLLVKAMEKTTDYYKLNCPITGEYKLGKNWNETH